MLEDDDTAEKILGLHFVEKRIAGDDVRVHQPQNGQEVNRNSIRENHQFEKELVLTEMVDFVICIAKGTG